MKTDNANDEAAVLAAWEPLDLTRRAPRQVRFPVEMFLLEAYRQPGRHYHNLHHIAECLRELEPVRPQCEDPLAVTAALLFHDYVYDPTKLDNEERSAGAAWTILFMAGWHQPFLEKVKALILATEHKVPPATNDAALVVDIDLSILGKPQEEFDAYEAAIRREYAHVPDAAFAAGRAKVLKTFLERPSVYATPTFRERYEQAARDNLARAVARWEVR